MFYTVLLVDPGVRLKYSFYQSKNKPELIENSKVVEFHADGHELEYIQRRFLNLPISHAYCTWKGEMAQFIYDNL